MQELQPEIDSQDILPQLGHWPSAARFSPESGRLDSLFISMLME